MTAIPCAACRKECFSEMFGTYLLVLVGPASVVVASMIPFSATLEALAFVGTAFGCTVAAMTLAIGRSSGAHINPAITIANTLAGNLRRELLIPYVLFQLVGALLAGASLKLAFGASVPSAYLGSTKLAVGISPLDGIALEIIGTFVLAMSALGASAFVRSRHRRAALVGFTLFLLIIFIGPLTGASFNPFRSLGPSIFSGYFDSQSVYWVGPLGGAACAGLTFRLWVRRRGQR